MAPVFCRATGRFTGSTFLVVDAATRAVTQTAAISAAAFFTEEIVVTSRTAWLLILS